MRKSRHFTLSAALLVLAAGMPIAGTAVAQPGIHEGLPLPGDLHIRVTHDARPAIRHEVVTERPGPNHVWIKGYWHHTGEAWAWNEGRWMEPPQPHAHWVAARYQKVHDGTRYTPGHWSHEHVIVD
jgi:hypothetical protein